MNKFIIILDGPMGAGKSTIAELVGAKCKRTAVVNEDKIKWFITDFKRCKRDNAIVRQVLISMAGEYLRQNISLIIPQGILKNLRPVEPFKNLAKRFNAKLHIYHLTAPKPILLQRIDGRRQGKKTLKPIAPSRIERNIRLWHKHRYNIGRELETKRSTLTTIVRTILSDIKT